MSDLHKTCLIPLTNIWESNFNLHNLELMIKKTQEVPKFRFEALEVKFEGHLTILCQLFSTYGDLKEAFNIKQMLHVLKIENWKQIPPFAFYLNPLADSLELVRKHLLEMRDLGHLRAKYFIEKNEEL